MQQIVGLIQIPTNGMQTPYAKLYTVDSFTNKEFEGNPAGVCISSFPLSNSMKLKIARELNLAETAFVVFDDKELRHSLTWFTPREEIFLCGHATLAAVKVLYSEGFQSIEKKVQFSTPKEKLEASIESNKIILDFPIRYTKKMTLPAEISDLLVARPIYFGTDKEWSLIELESEQDVKEFKSRFNSLEENRIKLFVITAKSNNKKYDFVSRCFAPAIGIDEDYVTGAAHCYLSAYWGEKLNRKLLVGKQLSSRPGFVACNLVSDERVLLSGEAVIMSQINYKWLVI